MKVVEDFYFVDFKAEVYKLRCHGVFDETSKS